MKKAVELNRLLLELILSVVEISFDKVVGHLLSDFMSLVIHESDKFWKFDLSRSLEIAISDSFTGVFYKVLLHQTADYESGSMVKCTQTTFHSRCCL